MYKLSTNSRRLLMSQTRRSMSTNTNATVRKSGLSKITLGALFVTAAGMAYYNNSGKITTEKEFSNTDSDSYERTKENVTYIGRDAIKEGKNKGSDALDELNAAGEHVKRSASLAGQAAKDTIYTVKEEGQATIHSFKDESQQLKNQLGNEVDRFASEHHLKEGNRSPEDVLSHDHHQTHTIVGHDPSASTADRASAGANKAAFTAANKFKDAKETISSDARKAADYLKEEKDKLVNTALDHNPMVHEKVSADKTKPDWETKLEDYAKNEVRDTSTLVEKDTNMAKEVWNDKKADMKETANDLKNKAESKTERFMGDTRETYDEVVKGSSSPRGPLEKKFAQPNVDTRKEGEDKSLWGSLFGPSKPEKHQTTYDYDVPDRFTANPMVLEKRHPKEKTKPDWETSLEEHAQEYTHDTTTLVDKDTDKVKKGVWDPKVKTNDRHAPIHGESRGVNILHQVEEEAAQVVEEIEEEASSIWSSLFGKSKATKGEAEIKWNDARNKAQDVKQDAASTWEDAKDRVSSGVNRVKRNVNATVDDVSDKSRNVADNVHQAASNAKEEGARLTRQASDRAEHDKDRLHGSLNDMHKEVSANAEKLKREGEQTAKSWYDKGTEQVRSGFDTVKDVADRDVQWVEEKVQDGVEGIKGSLSGTKEEMDRLLGFRNEKEEGVRGHVSRGERYVEEEEGILASTRSNIKLKPAKVVVEEAHGRDI